MNKNGNNLASNLFKAHSISSSGTHRSFPPLSPSIVLMDRPVTENGLDPASPIPLVAALEKEINTHKAKGVRLSRPFTPSQVLAFGAEMSKKPHPVCLAIKARLARNGHVLAEAPAVSSGIKLVEWIQPDGPIDLLTQILRIYSKAGIWNHLVLPVEIDSKLNELLKKFAMVNPNIVHSWQTGGTDQRAFSGSIEKNGSAANSSGRLIPLPGKPFWQVLSDPILLLLYLDQYGLKQVMRWRILGQDQEVMTMGKDLSWHFVKPAELTEERLDEICQLVESGGSVKTKWVRYNLERAFLIAYVTEMDVVVANSSLKHPRPEYITALGEQADLDLAAYLERGYTSVRPEYRGMGIGTQLLAGLTSRAGDRMIFSLISEDNPATQKIALRNHTRKVTTFFSQRTGKQMGVWMPESMLDRHFRKAP
jgi:GNAT superfamily N-acetyltransferase